jgi:hypothetical protein
MGCPVAPVTSLVGRPVFGPSGRELEGDGLRADLPLGVRLRTWCGAMGTLSA